MTPERAIEILNPEHREHYESIEPVNEACRMGMKALEKQIPKKVKNIDENHSYFVCENCGTAIYYTAMPKSHRYCLNCGQALDWKE